MRLRQGEQATFERLAEGCGRLRSLQGLLGNRDDSRERVLDPVVQFVQQELLPLLGPLALGDIDDDAEKAVDAAVTITERRAMDLDPAQHAIRPPDAAVEVPVAPGFDRRTERLPDPVAILRHDMPEESLQPPFGQERIVTEDPVVERRT